MSFRVAVACEDPTYDQFIIRPLVQALLTRLGKPRADVSVVTRPHAGGIARFTRLVCEFLELYGPLADVVLYVADADCEDGSPGRRNRSAQLANALEECESYVDKAVVVLAIQEIEVWALWGSRSTLGVPWEDVRSECHPKERFFNPLLRSADLNKPDAGRTRLMTQSLANGVQGLTQNCGEVADLASALSAHVSR